MRILFSMLCLLSFALSTVSCDKDEAYWPAYRQDLVEILTDGNGQITYLVRDNADTLSVSNNAAWRNLTPDTLFRALVLYENQESGKAVVHDISAIISPHPQKFDQITLRKQPVYVDAITRSGRYINFFLKIKTSDTGHIFGFADEGITDGNNHSKLLRLSLFHDRRGDGYSYKRQVCLSCPLYGYDSRLVRGRDSVEVQVATYDGAKTYRFAF